MIKKNLTRKDLTKKINNTLGFSKNFSSTIIDFFFDTLSNELKNNKNIKISSFGTFKVIHKNERIGRNPKTKVESKISARKVVKFTAASVIKKKLNSK
jgi:integration host factor subunit alpha